MIQQNVLFEGCIFEDITFGERRPNAETATLVKATHPANSLAFRECVFRNIQVSQQVRQQYCFFNRVKAVPVLNQIFCLTVRYLPSPSVSWLPDYFCGS